jgi:hypothetical protein
MGAIKKILLVIVTFLLFLSFVSAILFLVLSSSLTYENVQNRSVSIVHDVLQKNFNITSIVAKNYIFIQMYCQNHNNYVFTAENYTFDIPCNVSLNGQEAIIDQGVKEIIHQIYYKDYNCKFFDCFKEKGIPVFLISDMSRTSFSNFFFWTFLVSLILLACTFFLVEKKTSFPILSGTVLIIAASPFLKIGSWVNILSNSISLQFLQIFFSQSRNVSILFLIIGGLLLLLGIIFKIFKLGILISEKISNLKKDVSKKTNTKQGKPKPK